MILPKFSNLASRSFAHLAVVSLLLEQILFVSSATAQTLPITPDGTTNTQVMQTASGIDQVNIAAPNSNGLSHNKFSDYNINQTGQILNNFSGSDSATAIVGNGSVVATQTAIGGLVAINPNLINSGPANVILNEVTSANVSQLLGYLEVAGRKADVIIANPNGILCAGCGFINTAHLTMVGGRSQFDANGNLAGFNLSAPVASQYLVGSDNNLIPVITISGLGLDVRDVTATDIIARSTKIIASVYGSGSSIVSLKTGDRNFDYNTKAVTSNSGSAQFYDINGNLLTPGRELFAIDAAALSQIQAGRIYLVATKDGLGVNSGGDVIAGNEIHIDSAGNVYYQNLVANDSLTLSAIDAASINSDAIIAANILNINVTNFSNSGTIFGNDALNLTATNNLTNHSNILSNGDLNLVVNSSLVNSGTIYANNLMLSGSSAINNSGIVAANQVNLAANSLSNSGQLSAIDDLTLNIASIINNQEISSQNNLTITGNYLTNNALIQATKDLTLNVKSINNSNTKPSSAANSGIISSDGAVALNVNSINNDNGLVQGKNSVALNLQSTISDAYLLTLSLSNVNKNFTNISGSFISAGLTSINLGSNDYTITGDVSATNLDVTAKNITNLANVNVTDYISLTASNGTITNGVNGGTNNANIKLLAGTYISLAADSDVNNYGMISAATNLTIASRALNNNGANAKISGGAGTLTLRASGDITNSATSIITSGVSGAETASSAIISANNFNNYGELSVKNDLTATIANDLNNNSSALIWSGHNATLNVAHNLTNTSATIYADNNLTLQKSSSLNMNQLQNVSGTIQTYGGNVSIKADTFQNKRSSYKTQHVDGGLGGDYEYEHDTTRDGHIHAWFDGTIGAQSFISSGNNLTINSVNFTNDASSILASGNITINASGSLTNNSRIYQSYDQYISNCWNNSRDGCYVWLTESYKEGLTQESYNAYIKAGGSVSGTVAAQIDNVTIAGNAAINPNDRQTRNLTIGNVNSTALLAAGEVDLDLSGISSLIDSSGDGKINDGEFVINKNVNPNHPLIEARSEFVDQSKFFGSDYFFNLIGVNKDELFRSLKLTDINMTNQQMRFLGDSFTEQALLTKQITQLKKDAMLLSNANADMSAEIKALLDNSASEIARLNLDMTQVALKGLTKAQANALTKDVVLFTGKELNGQFILVPTLYLAQSNRSNVATDSGATISAKNDVNLISQYSGITNAGAISGNNISLTAAKDISISVPKINSGGISVLSLKDDAANARAASSFNAGTDIQLNSGGSINIANSYFQSGGSIFMNAANDINNSNYTIKAGNDVVMSAANINNIHTTTNSNETRIEGGRMVSLDATNDINNIGGTIKAGTLLYMTAGNDINNKALIDYKINGSSTNSDGSAITESQALASGANNIRSTLIAQGNLTSDGDIVLVARNNINNKASNITASGSGYIEATNGNITVETAALRDRTYAEGGSKKKHWVSVSDNTTNVSSDINFGGSLEMLASGTSGVPTNGNITIKGSDVTTADNLTMTAKNDINIISAQNSSYSFAAGRTGRGKSYLNESSSTTQISSNLTTTNNGDISINSGVGNADTIGAANSLGSLNVVASNLRTKDIDNNAGNNVGSGDINLTAKENVNIITALNTSDTHSISNKKGFSYIKSNEDITRDRVNVASNIIASGNVSNNANAGDINLSSGNNTNILGSNLAGTNGNIIVGRYIDTTSGDAVTINNVAQLNIASVQDLHYKYHHEVKLKTDQTAMVVGAVAAAAVVVVAVLAAPETGGASTALIASAPEIGAAAAGGAATGMGGKKGKTFTEETTQIIQKSTTLTFSGDLNSQSASDTTITASNLTADNATILAGKFRDSVAHTDTITDSDAKLNINSAYNISKTDTNTERVKPNYAGIAVVAGLSAYGGRSFINAINPVTPLGPQVPLMIGDILIPPALVTTIGGGYTGFSGRKNLTNPEQKSFMDPILNIRSESSSLDSRIQEIGTNLNFNNLITD